PQQGPVRRFALADVTAGAAGDLGAAFVVYSPAANRALIEAPSRRRRPSEKFPRPQETRSPRWAGRSRHTLLGPIRRALPSSAGQSTVPVTGGRQQSFRHFPFKTPAQAP